MPKSIVLLSDGTGNSAGKLFKTNVWRIYQSLDLTDPNIRAIYDDGVGTDTFAPLALVGGAVGLGLAQNVRDLYTFLCRTYEKGDHIYAFGFSRGAFTIRTLVGLITSQGLVAGDTDSELARNVRLAYSRHRRSFKTNWRLLYDWARELASSKPPKPAPEPLGYVPEIKFLGLWDTVAAYGLPIDELQRGIDRYFRALTFPDRDLSPRVTIARHALSIDDERRTFHPVLWNERCEKDETRIQQVWFPGVHSDVGGGYAKDTLSYVPLAWIMREAAKAGLSFKANALDDFEKLADPHGELHDSRSGLAAYYRYAPRRIETLCNDDYAKVSIARPKIHESVFTRIQDGRAAYAPLGIPADYDIVRLDGTVSKAGDGNARYESQRKAELRAGSKEKPGAQERAWDYVWYRRVLYFVTLAITVFLVAFPWLLESEASRGCHGSACFMSTHAIRPLGSALPGLFDRWVSAFAALPVWTVATLAALGLSMVITARVAAAIRESSERAWQRLKPQGSANDYAPGFTYKLRSASSLVSVYLWLARSVLPSMFALALVAGAAWTSLHGLFSWANASLECSGSKVLADVTSEAVPIEVDAKHSCRATALRVERDVTYRLTVEKTSKWRSPLLAFRDPLHPFRSVDTSIVDSARTARTSLNSVAKPARREPALRFLVKVGDELQRLGSDEFTPKQSGELLLFVDDVAAVFPTLWSQLHKHDGSTATVTVSRIPASKGAVASNAQAYSIN